MIININKNNIILMINKDNNDNNIMLMINKDNDNNFDDNADINNKL